MSEEHHSKEWKKFRVTILKRDEYTCQECKRKGINRTANNVHHVNPDDDSCYYSAQWLISLCESCHNKMRRRDNGKLTVDGLKWLARARRGLIKKIFV